MSTFVHIEIRHCKNTTKHNKRHSDSLSVDREVIVL
jgi:hypothetical protein